MQNSFSRSTQIYECATGFAIREAASTINVIKFSAVWNDKDILEDFTFTVAGTDPGKTAVAQRLPDVAGRFGVTAESIKRARTI
jgi:hypothetical protein